MNLYKYFAKNFGCRIVDAGLRVPDDVVRLLDLPQFETAFFVTFQVNEDQLLLSPEAQTIGIDPLIAQRSQSTGKDSGYRCGLHYRWLKVLFWVQRFRHRAARSPMDCERSGPSTWDGALPFLQTSGLRLSREKGPTPKTHLQGLLLSFSCPKDGIHPSRSLGRRLLLQVAVEIRGDAQLGVPEQHRHFHELDAFSDEQARRGVAEDHDTGRTASRRPPGGRAASVARSGLQPCLPTCPPILPAVRREHEPCVLPTSPPPSVVPRAALFDGRGAASRQTCGSASVRRLFSVLSSWRTSRLPTFWSCCLTRSSPVVKLDIIPA